MKILSSIKYPLLKAIDISGLTFLSPVVRLCYGEEPSVQLKKIGQWIIIPVAAMLLFIFAWNAGSGLIKTKAGTLPTPGETADALGSINTFADREDLKKEAYNLTGEERLAALAVAEAQLASITPKVQETTDAVAQAKSEHEKSIAVVVEPLEKNYDELKEKFSQAQDKRKQELESVSETLVIGDKASYTKFLDLVKANESQTDAEKTELSSLKAAISDARNDKSKKVALALSMQTKVAEEKQFLEKQIEQLTKRNRSIMVESAETNISTTTEELYQLTGADAYKKARSIAKDESRLEKTIESKYAQPATLWYQVRRSILCVFTGFIIGAGIAIPIGILCGLNSTFMAAMTPFIAIFKPVSPIVWLPIALIIVGGFIPDPENNAVIQWLWKAPLIDIYKINPAFIASAITVALCSLWATLANTALGVASIDKDHMNVARVLKLGFWSRLFKIVIPSALPLIFAGLRISLGVGWMVLIAAELLSSSEGIGKFVWDQFNNGASDSFAKMMVVVFVVGFVGLILDRIMIVFQRLVSFEGSKAAI
ncbi:ABC transporter permease subunit [Persicirhabdus sediminis]|uniref:ABC transporter permease subunit n=1 Tax=Persicirhabdus sediminis TaxID=454144 RepID=A0A8J7MC83_9BACT|nr:ABC transporter permease subunit [Persicirhabdus sediminis]MBK1789928.1 ABC transporter permease subunit [Persicirhabdus sediminis]